ncbi:MAG: RDD family protein [Cyanobacteria bacterium P01_G01_bin.54]
MPIFKEVTLQTPESVTLRFKLAGIGNRAYALLLDYFCWTVALFVFLIVWSLLAERLIEWLTPIVGDRFLNSLELWLVASYLLISFAIYVGYFVFFEVWWQGQTPGKRWVNIRVIQANGRPARLPQALLRALLRPIDDISFLGAVVILLNRQEKRLGDWIAGTVVIQEETTTAAAKISLSAAAQSLGQQVLEQADLARLSPEDFATLRIYLQRHPTMLASARRAKSQELARQLQTRLALLELPPETKPLTILQAVYWAYQQAYGDRL